MQQRMFPLPDILLRALERQYHMADEVCGAVKPDGPLFFRYSGPHRGQPIRRFYRAWRKAAKQAGLEGTIFHDMRRSAIRNLVRDGVPETVAMRLTGHKTRSVFKRYDIVDERDLLEAMEKMNARLKR
ncbi:MAG: tyrosine-type recombinase/integrase [Gemmatimonadota bacterium]